MEQLVLVVANEVARLAVKIIRKHQHDVRRLIARRRQANRDTRAKREQQASLLGCHFNKLIKSGYEIIDQSNSIQFSWTILRLSRWLIYRAVLSVLSTSSSRFTCSRNPCSKETRLNPHVCRPTRRFVNKNLNECERKMRQNGTYTASKHLAPKHSKQAPISFGGRRDSDGPFRSLGRPLL